VFLNIMLSFGRRGWENLAGLRGMDFAVTRDDNEIMYVYLTRDFQTKNHQDNKSSDGHMFQIKDSHRFPLKPLVKYMRHLKPICQAFFQVPRPEPIENIFYNNVHPGNNKLGNFVRTISEEAGLSKIYTNHCLRATTVHILDKAQIPS
ncbi:hypothetical protein MAR_000116, partial [Mya arenaria]